MTRFIAPTRTLHRLTDNVRRRRLASDDRAGSWTRGQVRDRWLFFIKRRWRLLVTMGLAAATPLAVGVLLVPNNFLRGVIVGGGSIAIFVMLAVLVVQATGTANLSQGASAEQLTAGELRPLIAHGWRLVNHVSLRRWDIDHVLVGPAGVVVVETKWSSHPWHVAPPSTWVMKAVRQAVNNANDVRDWFGLGHVWSAVFLWSPLTADAPTPPEAPIRVGGAQVVAGRSAASAWRHPLESPKTTLSPVEVDQLWRKIDAASGTRSTGRR